MLFLYAHNVEYDIPLGDVLVPLAISVAGAGSIMTLAWFLLRRDALRAGLATSVLVVLFFSYGQVYGVLGSLSIGGVALGWHGFLLPLWGLLAVGGVVVAARAGPRLPTLTRGLNAVAAILVVSNLITAAWYELRTTPAEVNVASDVLQAERLAPRARESPGLAKKRMPDIYYIIFDRYSGEDALRTIFRYDNTPFLSYLRSKGFYVASDSTANYPRTSHSLASSLNLAYLDDLLTVSGPSGDYGPAYELIKRSAVPRYLKKQGYRYIHLGSWWEPTASNPQADLNIEMQGSLSEFATQLLGTTAFSPVGGTLSAQFDFAQREYLRVLFQFDQLEKTRRVRGPKFVFAHILLPHEPFVFDRNGSFVPEEVRHQRSREQNYLEQLMFANSKMRALVEVLLSGPEDRRPVIILQSDEGAFEGFASGLKAGAESVKRKFSILNAYYLPGVVDSPLYQWITPVNSFRVIFDLYFEADLPLLPDRNYAWLDPRHLYTFVDLTDRVGLNEPRQPVRSR